MVYYLILEVYAKVWKAPFKFLVNISSKTKANLTWFSNIDFSRQDKSINILKSIIVLKEKNKGNFLILVQKITLILDGF